MLHVSSNPDSDQIAIYSIHCINRYNTRIFCCNYYSEIHDILSAILSLTADLVPVLRFGSCTKICFRDRKEVQPLPIMVSAVLNDVKSCKILLKPLKLGYRFTDVVESDLSHHNSTKNILQSVTRRESSEREVWKYPSTILSVIVSHADNHQTTISCLDGCRSSICAHFTSVIEWNPQEPPIVTGAYPPFAVSGNQT